MRSFSAPYDRGVKIISAVVAAILLVLVATTQSIIAGGFCALIVAVGYAYSPRGYVIADGAIVVKRLAGSIRIPIASIRSARAATADDLAGALRLWGNGGMFGYYGLYSTSRLGKCTWYVTDRRRAVVLVTDAKILLLSPDDVPAFLAALPNAPASGSFQPCASATGGIGAGAIVAVAIAVVVLTAIAAAFLYSPGAPAYTLTPTQLTIHDRFYPVTLNASAVDVSHIRIVDMNADREWRPVLRTNGFSNPHYHSGWFRVAGGQTVRMYWAAAGRLVLLPPNGSGAPVLLDVKDPEGFVATIQREWRH